MRKAKQSNPMFSSLAQLLVSRKLTTRALEVERGKVLGAAGDKRSLGMDVGPRSGSCSTRRGPKQGGASTVAVLPRGTARSRVFGGAVTVNWGTCSWVVVVVVVVVACVIGKSVGFSCPPSSLMARCDGEKEIRNVNADAIAQSRFALRKRTTT